MEKDGMSQTQSCLGGNGCYGVGISWFFSCLKDKHRGLLTVAVFLLAENIILVQVTKASTYVRSCLFSEWLLK
jgi:hypothetical protein